MIFSTITGMDIIPMDNGNINKNECSFITKKRLNIKYIFLIRKKKFQIFNDIFNYNGRHAKR